MLSIPYVNMPNEAPAGSEVTLGVAVQAQEGVLATVNGNLDGLSLYPVEVNTWIPGGATSIFTFRFTMPNHDAVFYLTPQYYVQDPLDPNNGWWVSEGTGTVTVFLSSPVGKGRGMNVAYGKV